MTDFEPDQGRWLPIRVGPPVLTINRDDRVVIAGADATIDPTAEQGFFARDTRFVARYELLLNGRQPLLLNSSSSTFYSSRFEFTNPDLGDGPGTIAERQLSLRLERTVAGAVHEDYDITSYARRPVRLSLAISAEPDFADLFEVKEPRLARSRQIAAAWDVLRHEQRFSYVNGDFRVALVLRPQSVTSVPGYRDGRVEFEISLGPRQSWHACVLWLPITADDGEPSALPCHAVAGRDGVTRRLAPVDLETRDPVVGRAWHRAAADLEALTIAQPDTAPTGLAPATFVPAAGIPWFLTLFGRDSLITGMYAISVFPELATGALAALARAQASDDDPVRDEEPGKILHEIRHGELTHLGLLPHSPYYGTHDSTPLFLITLSELFRWSGDRTLPERYTAHIDRCLDWIDRFGDRDGDGFQEYARRSESGYYNQGWKDHGDAIPAANGSLAPLPLALCELQGYVYDAKLRTAELYEVVGRPADAARLRSEAAQLYARFNEHFWWGAEGTYYLGLDGHKVPIASVASNAGHLLASGIVPPERAAQLVDRLLRPDMWSGWGIRTLSAAHAAYNPFAYHTGTVWPHDNAMIAAGMRRYGYAAEAARVARATFDAAASFQVTRLPELFAGLERQPDSFPVQYLGANVPQAWAAAAVFRLVTAMAGLDARAERSTPTLYVDPALPEWLPDLTIRGLRVGRGRLELHIANDSVDVLANTSGCEIVRGAAPEPRQQLTADPPPQEPAGPA